MEYDWLTTAEAARIIRIHPVTLTQWAKRGYIPATKVSRSWRFSRQLIDDWMLHPERRPGLAPTTHDDPPPATDPDQEKRPLRASGPRL